MASSEPWPSHDLFNSCFITILVGPQKVQFEEHENLILHYSGYFRGAVRTNFKEAIERVIILDDEDAEIFRLFHGWLYTGHFAESPKAEIEIPLLSLVKLYLFGERRVIPQLQDLVILIIHQNVLARAKSGLHAFPCEVIKTIYDETTESSLLREYFVQLMVHTGSQRILLELPEFTWEYLAEVLNVFLSWETIKRKSFDFFNAKDYLHPDLPALSTRLRLSTALPQKTYTLPKTTITECCNGTSKSQPVSQSTRQYISFFKWFKEGSQSTAEGH